MTRAEVVIRVGDGDDALTVTRVSGALHYLPTVEGGDGADTITSGGIVEGGPGNDRLTGTDRDEGMSGGAGDDVLRGLGGDDDLLGDTEPQDGSRSGPEGDDVIDGGPGTDSLPTWRARCR